MHTQTGKRKKYGHNVLQPCSLSQEEQSKFHVMTVSKYHTNTNRQYYTIDVSLSEQNDGKDLKLSSTAHQQMLQVTVL